MWSSSQDHHLLFTPPSQQQGLQVTSHIHQPLEMFAPLHSAWHKSELVEYKWWERVHQFDTVGAHSWCWPTLYRFLWVGSGCGFFDCLPAAVIIDCARRQLCQPGAYWDLWGSHLTQGITTMSYRFKPTHICSCPLMVTLEPLQAGKNLLVRRYFGDIFLP